MDGWIKIHRTMLTHPLWTCKPYSKGQAWLELLLLANHTDKKMMINDKWVVIKRGQLYTSTLKLADRWGWSRGKVVRFLDVLKMDGMLYAECTKGGTTNGTTLTIVNYDVYQDGDTTDSTTNDTTNGQRSVQRTDINKNIKKEKNNNIITPLYSPKGETAVVENELTGAEVEIIGRIIDPTQEKEKSCAKKEKETKHKYGEYNNVLLTDSEAQKLRDEYGDDALPIVTHFSELKAMKGYKYKSDYLAIRKWGASAYYEHKKRGQNGDNANSFESIQERAARSVELGNAISGMWP